MTALIGPERDGSQATGAADPPPGAAMGEDQRVTASADSSAANAVDSSAVRPPATRRGPSTRGVEIYTRQTIYWSLAIFTCIIPLPAMRAGDLIHLLIVVALAVLLLVCCLVTVRLQLNRMLRDPDVRLSRRAPPGRTELVATGIAFGTALLILWRLSVDAETGAVAIALGVVAGMIGSAWTPMLSARQAVLAWGGCTGLAVAGWLMVTSVPAAAALFAVPASAAMVLTLVAAIWASAWTLRVATELDRARRAAARLAVAEERLRFSRDLHDVIGSTLAAVSLKTQLAAGMTRKGRTEEALAELDEVRVLADDAARQARAVAHGYRQTTLAQELAAARDLLAAASISCQVRDDAGEAPDELGWAVREGVTNVLRHSAARWAEISLASTPRPGRDGSDQAGTELRIRNDRPHSPTPGGSPAARGVGLVGLAERLAPLGGIVDTRHEPDQFELIVWLPDAVGTQDTVPTGPRRGETPS